jgi:hypothetical protein
VSRRAGLLVVGALALAGLASCSGEPLFATRGRRDCAAPRLAIDHYLQDVAARVSNRMRGDVLARHEQVFVSFAFADDGAPTDFRVERADRPAAREAVLQAAAAAAPLPRAPFDPQACVHGGRATISLIGHSRCDETLGSEYNANVARRIQDAVNAEAITAVEPDRVTLRVRIDHEGVITEVTVRDARDAQVAERVAAVARRLGRFEAPRDVIVECVSDQPIFVWISLPGLSRPPIRVR